MTPVWANKFRPQTIDGYVFQNINHKHKFQEFIATKSIPNLLFSGNPGTGKTTIARILINEIIDRENKDFDVKVVDASTNNGVDVVRTTVANFIETYPMGDFKIIHLEEADRLSPAAQDTLRVLTEDYTDSVRFIITCNHPNKLIPALRSRFTQYHFDDMPYEDVIERMIDIALEQQIEPNLEVLQECIDAAYPDLRQIITNMQDCVVDGVLVSKKLLEAKVWRQGLITGLMTSDWNMLHSITQKDIPDNDYEDFYTALYENVQLLKGYDFGTINYDMSMILIAEYLYKHASFGQPHINAGALILRMKHIGKI